MKGLIENTTLTNIANAIREKGGTTAQLKPSQMASAIAEIPTGGMGMALDVDMSDALESKSLLWWSGNCPQTSTTGSDWYFLTPNGTGKWDGRFVFVLDSKKELISYSDTLVNLNGAPLEPLFDSKTPKAFEKTFGNYKLTVSLSYGGEHGYPNYQPIIAYKVDNLSDTEYSTAKVFFGFRWFRK